MAAPFGMYLFNPGKRKKARKSRRRRSARRSSSGRFSKKNPTMKTRRRRRARSARRNPSRRRRSSRRARVVVMNPRRRRRSRRSSMTRRNPSRRRRGFRSSRRNPGSGIIAEFTNQDMLINVGGLVTAGILAPIIVDKLSKPGSSLPGLDPTKPTTYGRTIWKAGIAGAAGFLLRSKAPRFAEGLMLGAVAMLVNDVLVQSGVVSQIRSAAGVGRNYPAARGAGYLPGTSTRFTGPAQRFLTRNNAPRPGMGAAVRPGFVAKTAGQAEGAFTGAN